MPLEIFVGPIVRAVSPQRVCIWIATFSLAELQVSVLADDKVCGTAVTRSISLRDRLFVHLAEIRPSNGTFPTDRILNYRVGVPVGNSFDYQDFEKLVVSDQLAYGNEKFDDLQARIQASLRGEAPKLPGFVIPSKNTALNFAFGSCRKIHDKGNDAFALLDTSLRSTWNDLGLRPIALFLGGDQIYADDVEQKDVLPAVIELSKKLSLIEQLPTSATHTISYLHRSQIVKEAGFTTTLGDGHLLSFGEYVAMYGLVLNGNNWRGFGSGGVVAEFLTSLSAARRVLANCATYMIFDDHDVTDDWFITNRNRELVLANGNGRRVVANAMAAYFLFQGWGNAPEKFDFQDCKKSIEDHVNTGSDKKRSSPFDTFFLKQHWEYSTATSPPVYLLDTRTARGGTGFPPILKSVDAWKSTAIEVENKNLPFVLIAAGPLVSFPGIDELQALATQFPETGNTGSYGADLESWFANPINYRLLFDHFKSKGISKVVVVSGDVHYGFSALFSLANKEHWLGLPGGHAVKGVQITSSGLKNSAKPLGFVATTPYHGSLYFLIFRDNSVRTACDKAQAENRVLTNRMEKLSPGSARTSFPTYAVSGQQWLKLVITGPLPNQFEYQKLPPEHYPDMILELRIRSLSPLTANFIENHNYVWVRLNQNQVDYRFNNNGQTYNHQL